MKSRFNIVIVPFALAVLLLLAGWFGLAVLIPVAECAAVIALVAIASANGVVYLRRKGHPTAFNSLPGNVGSSDGRRRYRASGALATRYLFVKAGADDEHIAAIAAASDKPIGVITDEAAAAEDPITVALLGNDRTLPCVAGAALATLNADVYMDAAGKVVGEPTAAGTYWKVGRNLTLAGAADDPVEVETCEPVKVVVIAALTAPATADAADLATAEALANALKADITALGTALASPAQVKVLAA